MLFPSAFFCQKQIRDTSITKVRIGTAIELSVLFNSKHFDLKNQENFTKIYPLSLYLFGIIPFTDNFALDFKPGWVVGGEEFSAIELGIYIQYYFNRHTYFIRTGINMHKNIGEAHGTFYSTNESVFFIGVMLGFKPTSNFAFTLGYYYPLSNYPYYSDLEDYKYSYSVILNHLLKLGMEIEF